MQTLSLPALLLHCGLQARKIASHEPLREARQFASAFDATSCANSKNLNLLMFHVTRCPLAARSSTMSSLRE